MAIWNGFLGVLTLAFQFFTGIAGGNYVVGVVLLTVAVRLILFPLGVSQVRSFQKMAKLAPKQRELQAKYKGKGNNQQMQQELAQLYKEEGVNPAAGCLPLLLQLPVMYGLFDVLQHYKYLAGHGLFIWQNLAVADPTYTLAALVAVSTFFMQRQSMRLTPPQPGMEQSQKMMTWMMPLIFGYVAARLAAGLSIYYVTSNLFQLGQTYFLMRTPADGAAPKATTT
jgi:YidC/Oxa1 family membrane protein insertase